MTKEQENQPVVAPIDILVGTIVSYGVAFDQKYLAQQGWLPCDGAAVSRTTYAALFAVVGVTHGEGDGKTTFNMPDYRGRFQRGVNYGASADPDASSRVSANHGGTSGNQVGSVQPGATGLPTVKFTTDKAGDHNHSVPHLPTDSSWYQIAGSHYARWNSGSVDSSKNGNHNHTINGGGDVETRPVNLYVNYIIYTGYKTS